jgi:hypothetical protein
MGKTTKSSNYNVLFIISTFLIYFSAFSQKIDWEKSFGGNKADYLMDMQPTADYGFIVAGSSLSSKSGNKKSENIGDLDYLISKMDEKGELEWQKSFGGFGLDFLQSARLTNDGGFILAGNSNSNEGADKSEDSKGLEDFWIIKLNAKGQEEWQKTIGGYGQEKVTAIIQTKDGGYFIGGSTSSKKSGNKTEEGYGNLDVWILKLDKKGTIEWQKTYGGKYFDELRSFDQTFDGGFILGVYSNSPESEIKKGRNFGQCDYWILKLDRTGAIQWQKNYGGNKDDKLYSILQTKDNGFLVGGNSDSDVGNIKTQSNTNGTDFWILKLDEDGEITWQRTYDFAKVDILMTIIENKDDTYLIGGYAQGELSSNKLSKLARKNTDDFIALKIKSTGEEIWNKIVGSEGSDILKKLIETRDGGYIMAGTSNPSQKPQDVSLKSKNIKNTIKDLQTNKEDFDQLKNEVSNEIGEIKSEVSDKISSYQETVLNETKDFIGLKEGSPIKLGYGESTNSLGLPSGAKNDKNSNEILKSEKKLPASKDKKNNLGNNDFWIVKLYDDKKEKVEKVPIEAFPNPTSHFTNVILNHDFKNGNASLYDLAGRQLQNFEINQKTIPVDLSGLPDGI